MAHWYSRESGLLMPPAALKNGSGYRDYDLRDARKDLALASVTNILSSMSKPGLDAWKLERAIKQARISDLDADLGIVLKAAFQEAEDAAEFGTAVHAGLAAGFRGQSWLCPDIRVRMVVDAFWPWWYGNHQEFTCDQVEVPFANTEWGFAGTADYKGRELGYRPLLDAPCLIDFKTQDAETEADFNFYDPDYPLQLAGYALGLDETDATRISVLISRTRPGLCKLKVWEHNDRYLAMWIHLLAFWQHRNSYYPGEVIKPPNIEKSLHELARQEAVL